LWFEEQTKVKEYYETQDRMIWNNLAAGMTAVEAIRSFEEYWATINKYY
jgi:hypothetical protein